MTVATAADRSVMPARSVLSQTLRTLAGRTREFHEETANRLESLADAIVGIMTERWQGLDLVAVIAPDRLLGVRLRLGLVGALGWLRDVVMLVPIFITWAGVGLAVAAYDTYAHQHPGNAQQSFLYLWETGLGNQPYLSLSWVARLDAGVILLLIALVFGVPVLERGRRRRAEALVDDIHSALADATVYLNDAGTAVRPPSPAHDAARRRIVDTILEGGEAGGATEAMANAVAQLAVSVTDLVDGQGRLTDRMTSALEELERTTRGLTSTTEVLQRTAETLASSEERFLQELGRHLAAQGELINGLREVSRPLEETLRETTSFARTLMNLAQQMRDMGNDLLVNLERLHRTEEQALRELVTAAGDVSAMSAGVRRPRPADGPSRPEPALGGRRQGRGDRRWSDEP
jgi:archaellum component FlaC